MSSVQSLQVLTQLCPFAEPGTLQEIPLRYELCLGKTQANSALQGTELRSGSPSDCPLTELPAAEWYLLVTVPRNLSSVPPYGDAKKPRLLIIPLNRVHPRRPFEGRAVAQRVKTSTAEPDGPVSMPGIRSVEGKDRFPQVVL